MAESNAGMGKSDRSTATVQENVQEVVPFLAVSNMAKALHFYRDGLGFTVAEKWEVRGQIRWCRLQLGQAALMLQQFPTEGHDAWTPKGQVGEGISLCFICTDALAIYQAAISRGITASEPIVGNGMWVTTLLDPDGYKLEFESSTDVPADTRFSQWTDENSAE